MINKIKSVMNRRIKELGLTKKSISQQAGYSNSILSEFLRGSYNMRLDSLVDHLEFLGLELVVIDKNTIPKRYDIISMVDQDGKFHGTKIKESENGIWCKWYERKGST